MPLLGDIAMIFIHFHTLLIILGLPIDAVHPSASFCFLLFLYFRFFHHENCQKNSRKKIYKLSVAEPSGPPKLSRRGAPRGRGALVARPPLGRAVGPPGRPWCLPTPPFGVYLKHVSKPAGREPF